VPSESLLDHGEVYVFTLHEQGANDPAVAVLAIRYFDSASFSVANYHLLLP